MKITRKAFKQSGDALEQAVRRDMNGAIAVELDRAIFLGTGANGQSLGVITGAGTCGIRSPMLGRRFVPPWFGSCPAIRQCGGLTRRAPRPDPSGAVGL
jgi:hypothetical protein